MIHELVGGSPTAYPSGQVFEGLTGYDVALRPGSRGIWDLLRAGVPPGIVLTSGLWSGSEKSPPSSKLPRNLVSLILQVKRPQWLDHWRAGQFHHWRGPYFRFHIVEGQQSQLQALESNLADAALVRYVAPAFLSVSDLYMHQHGHGLAQHSTFVAPSVLTGHRLWSYDGPGISGYANSEGAIGESDTEETLFERAASLARRVSLEEHLLELASRLDLEAGPTRWPIGGLDGFELSLRKSKAVQAWSIVAQTVAFAGAEWMILDLDH